jgi:2-keto-4-pentenoate hydratase/2-oxohepta-3-ene-1,7-dioic acid hydratase in catechol pathway
LAGRPVLLDPNGAALDVAAASDGRFAPDPQALFERWDELVRWSEGQTGNADIEVNETLLGPPTPLPPQVFAIGLNYADHADEASIDRPKAPPVFTKFPTSITGPVAEVALPSRMVDWEVELVVVLGRRSVEVAESAAWSHVAGLMVGQDLSERAVQLAGPVPQFSLGKSYTGFSPVGPAVVTIDEVSDPDDLPLSCSLGDEELQNGRTKDLIFAVPELIARLSAVCPLLPGDLIFTGTPSGVGMARTPPRFLEPGATLTSRIGGLGELRTSFTAGHTYT